MRGSPDDRRPAGGTLLFVPGRIATAVPVALLALLTLSVVWAGLDGPPPLWIVEYGLPGEVPDEPRVAVVAGVGFLEVRAGYYRVPVSRVSPVEELTDRIMEPLFPASLPAPGATSPVGVPGTAALLPFAPSRPLPGWVEIASTVWVAVDASPAEVGDIEGTTRAVGRPMRTATTDELRVARFLRQQEPPAHPGSRGSRHGPVRRR